MRKYLTVFAVDWQNQFIYRLNFVLWRLRNVLRLLLTFFLWEVVFTGRSNAFGYSHSQMIGYVFLVLLVQTQVMSAPSNDNMGGEIGSGDLSNYLVKPIGYLKYWFTRDMSSKLLNSIFSIGELTLLWVIIKPQISISLQPLSLLVGILVLIIAIISYFLLTKIAIFATFWIPENSWGLMFMILVLMEMLAGVVFPLDVLPANLQTILQFTPFPYLIYYPIAILVGKITGLFAFRILLQSFVWLLLISLLTNFLWKKGLKVYSATGK